MCIAQQVVTIVIQQEGNEMIKMHKYKIFISLFTILQFVAVFAFGQTENEYTEGEVSYITGKNIYVKFRNTEGIKDGDSLFIRHKDLIAPVLVVQNHSSISCLCTPLNDFSFKVSDKVYAKVVKPELKEVTEIQKEELPEKDVNEQVMTSSETVKVKAEHQQDISGRISVSSYSNISGTESENLHRFRYTLSMKAANVSDSRFSLETYISFTHKLNQWDVVKENLNDALKIYSLALKYDFSETSALWAGRKINPKIANVGAIDGLQFEKQWNHFFAGAAVGTRPDYLKYGHNIHLPEYGAYIGHSGDTKNGHFQSTLAFFEQRNQSNIDRRFVYFQHTNSSVKNLNIFSSFEIDLYKLENDKPKNALTLTSLYFSARYRFTSRLSLFGSYDNRKNVIYYETFRNYSEEILKQASRQGLRFRVNYRPVNYLIVSVNAGTRFRKEEPRPTKTLNGLVTYSRIPLIDASFTASANLMQTVYLDGQVFGGRLNKDIIPGKLSSMFNYRHVNFSYFNSNSNLKQNIGEVDFSFQMSKKWYFSVNFEATFQEGDNFNRLYFNLRRKL